MEEKDEHDVYSVEKNDLIFIGLCGVGTPLRPMIHSSISNLKNAGIECILLTGDRADTAKQIGWN